MSTNRINRFHQIQPKGLILGFGPNICSPMWCPMWQNIGTKIFGLAWKNGTRPLIHGRLISFTKTSLKNINTKNQASSLYMWQGWTWKKFIKLGRIKGLMLENWTNARIGHIDLAHEQSVIKVKEVLPWWVPHRSPWF